MPTIARKQKKRGLVTREERLSNKRGVANYKKEAKKTREQRLSKKRGEAKYKTEAKKTERTEAE